MKLLDRAPLALASTALCIGTACGPLVNGAGSGPDSDTEGTTGTTTADDPTDPTVPTTTADPSMGTGDVTGQPTTTTATTANPTTGVDGTTGGGSDSCCEAHASPGCNEEAVVDCVCAQEASCCAFEWEQGCVDLAMAECMATCDDPGTTGDPGTGTTGDPGTACTEIVTFEIVPSDAIYDGDWSLGMSMVGEGEISLIDQNGNGAGSFRYEPEIPCDDTWYIWARAFDQGQNDSYFATLDGEPLPEAIFEGGCTIGGNGYTWARLNWRDPMDGPCTYVQDPWAPDWTAGVHQIQFSFRESPAMGRILITNDQDFVPM